MYNVKHCRSTCRPLCLCRKVLTTRESEIFLWRLWLCVRISLNHRIIDATHLNHKPYNVRREHVGYALTKQWNSTSSGSACCARCRLCCMHNVRIALYMLVRICLAQSQLGPAWYRCSVDDLDAGVKMIRPNVHSTSTTTRRTHTHTHFNSTHAFCARIWLLHCDHQCGFAKATVRWVCSP